MPPRWHHHISPAAASLTAPQRCVVGKVCGSLARNESRQSRDYEPKGPLLPTNHGTLWQVAKSITLNGMNALTSGLLTTLSFLQKPKMRTSTSIVNWYTMVHWHSNVQSNLISSNLFCTKPPRSQANMLQTSCEFPPVFKCSKHCRFASLAGLGAKSFLRTACWESIESIHRIFGKIVTCAQIAIWCIQ